MDGDDYIALHTYELVFSQMVSTNVDIISFGYSVFQDNIENNGFHVENIEYKVPNLMYGDDIFKAFCMGYIYPAVWAKIYRRNFLIDNFDYDFMPSGFRAEDVPATYKIFSKAQSLINIPINLYYYRVRENSLDRSITEQYVRDLYLIFANILDYIKKGNKVEPVYFNILLLIHSFYTYSQVKAYLGSQSCTEKSNTYMDILSDVISDIIKYSDGFIDYKEFYTELEKRYHWDNDFIKIYKNIKN